MITIHTVKEIYMAMLAMQSKQTVFNFLAGLLDLLSRGCLILIILVVQKHQFNLKYMKAQCLIFNINISQFCVSL